MKKCWMILLVLLLLTTGAVAECTCACSGKMEEEVSAFQGNQQLVYDALRLSDAFPKSAQVLSAMEYFCKADEYQLHLLLIHATQNETINSIYGVGSKILMVDLDDGKAYTYQNISYPESSEIASKEDAVRLMYGAYDSFLNGYNEYVWSDQEIVYEVSSEAIEQINEALRMYFSK